MNRDTDPFAGEWWEDIAYVIASGRDRRSPEFQDAPGRAYRMVALNINCGKAAHSLVMMDVHGRSTPIDVATALADLIMGALVALDDYVPDVREFLEIQTKDYRITLESPGQIFP